MGPDDAAFDPSLQVLVEHRQGASRKNRIVEGAKIELRSKHLLGVLTLLQISVIPR